MIKKNLLTEFAVETWKSLAQLKNMEEANKKYFMKSQGCMQERLVRLEWQKDVRTKIEICGIKAARAEAHSVSGG